MGIGVIGEHQEVRMVLVVLEREEAKSKFRDVETRRGHDKDREGPCSASVHAVEGDGKNE